MHALRKINAWRLNGWGVEKKLSWNLRALLLIGKGQSGGLLGLQLYTVPARDNSITGFQWLPSYIFCGAEKKGGNPISCWYIAALQFAAFSMIFHSKMSGTFHPGFFDWFSDINYQAFDSYKYLISRWELLFMQEFLQTQLSKNKLKLQVLRISEIRLFLFKCHNTYRGVKLAGICAWKCPLMWHGLGRELWEWTGQKRADSWNIILLWPLKN